jgi:hypothetical protein
MFPWQPSHVTVATDTHATIEELWEAMFSVGSTQSLHNEANWRSQGAYRQAEKF